MARSILGKVAGITGGINQNAEPIRCQELLDANGMYSGTAARVTHAIGRRGMDSNEPHALFQTGMPPNYARCGSGEHGNMMPGLAVITRWCECSDV